MTTRFDITTAAYTRFTFERDDRILTAAITSDHPVNGVDAAMHEELGRVFTDLQRDSNSDIIILTGKGRAFCAGGDFDWFDEQISDPSKFRDIAWEAKRIVTSILDMEKPIICRLNGAAAGLGATIALLCDMIVSDEKALIGDPHVKVGLVAGDGGAVIWPQLVGFAKAKELLMTGDLLTARGQGSRPDQLCRSGRSAGCKSGRARRQAAGQSEMGRALDQNGYKYTAEGAGRSDDGCQCRLGKRLQLFG
ncbi:MAG: enoyl-CoA hydratase/isomerase family protein [Pseudomonadota bacterium]